MYMHKSLLVNHRQLDRGAPPGKDVFCFQESALHPSAWRGWGPASGFSRGCWVS